ncbi:ferric-chelate reductase [Trichophyton equinum CBS 127.97]|uniref:Ferric-chelate reductase n=1 Tax=Trichophyton equinum (strain ATCC MYA-4606 / CBS 127.97) TaxID=559882 RepID=F2PQ77_TRIEC|nr:ferric-chelate reductase [Trichophyton equinum CBS 127.97]
MVVSWSNEAQESLELIVQPRNRLTADLFYLTSIGPEPTISLPAFISRPHGVSQSVEEYETILMVASELGVMAIIPYLKRLIYRYKAAIYREVDKYRNHERAAVYSGVANLKEIFQQEISGEHIPTVEEVQGKMLVLVSASNNIRDGLRGLVRNHLDKNVKISQLEFQPE